MAKTKPEPGPQSYEKQAPLHPVLVFAPIFTVLFLLHGAVLRLPYYWDEAGYFIPAAYDLFKTGDLIPHTTLSNAHPPLLMAFLALWWKLSNFAPAATRTAMLLISAAGLTGLYVLARRVANEAVAVATVCLTAAYSVFFAQSSLAHLDVPVFALSMWAIYKHVSNRHAATTVLLAFACISKETAVVVPLTIFAWEVTSTFAHRYRPEIADKYFLHPRPLWKSALHLLALVPLILWFAYHYHRTGFVLGNPEYLRYNMGATLSPLRILVAFIMRLWHAFGYMNMFVLTGATVLAMKSLPLRDRRGHADIERPRIAIRFQILFGVLILAHAVEFAVLGGALLARYMLPVIPLVILVCVSTLYRRIEQWKLWTAAIAVAFIFALFFNPPWRISSEDNLAYADFVRLHRSAADYLEKHYADDRVLTAWPASDEINRPFLGYVQKPITVVRVENFTLAQMMQAAQQRENFDVVMAFNTKYEPPRGLLTRIRWWNRLQERYFDYHSDISPEEIARLLHGRIAWHQRRGAQWVALIELDKARYAEVEHTPPNF